ncbi:hypothetical protein GCM10010168_62220 [Actinoplanes ianthinogenes]|uniref:ABC transporter permease n=1 Tax=Actinoplanes ianthinogenes TaxID=122358 RepID=A0ABN6C1W6_9ACTN|nr:hypothetical protein [Actinoplanes ianthinogenes]BCJ39530.1 hypothetical protein Aiant_01870 [Actinoplanes ianthinogenes]GGR35470.1 hypothetical protein GCM10010168_62220 [Actinoplanes ianthinogenes]
MNAARITHAEVRKLLTLPAIRTTTVLTVLGTLLLATTRQDGIRVLQVVQVGFLALGVFATTHEFQAGGQIRTTLLASPRRLLLTAAKGTALVTVTVPVAVVVALTATVPAGDSGKAPAAVVYLALTSLLAAAVGLLLRHSVTAVAVLLPAYLIAAPMLRAHSPAFSAWLPDTALTDPTRGAAALIVWAAAASVLAAARFHSRDA